MTLSQRSEITTPSIIWLVKWLGEEKEEEPGRASPNLNTKHSFIPPHCCLLITTATITKTWHFMLHHVLILSQQILSLCVRQLLQAVKKWKLLFYIVSLRKKCLRKNFSNHKPVYHHWFLRTIVTAFIAASDKHLKHLMLSEYEALWLFMKILRSYEERTAWIVSQELLLLVMK